MTFSKEDKRGKSNPNTSNVKRAKSDKSRPKRKATKGRA